MPFAITFNRTSILLLITVCGAYATNITSTDAPETNAPKTTSAASDPQVQVIQQTDTGSVLIIAISVTIGLAVVVGVTGCIVCGVCRRK